MSALNKDYMGMTVHADHIYNPLLTKDFDFINRIIKMDELSFGPGGMGMPRWVLFDCALIPGAVIGFGIPANQLTSADQALLKVVGDDFVPLSMYIAIPNADGKSWFGHNLSSLNGILKEDLKGLGLLTKYYALGVLKIEKLIGATQWDSAALGLHLKLSPMKLLASHVSIHTHENTLCYESFNFYPEEQVLGDQRPLQIKTKEFTSDLVGIKNLQKRIEAGEEIILISKDSKQSVFHLQS
ncbi:MAG: hypothetical protein COV71_02805 [Candidatus Omnitrophica bacterium CG11_big_fil_rev_8_21_14_0_20_41_12]|nr:MAG: hypothetical protein COV71_02805 [Candidatus Omnitrophica bacterium CG11_big_fil_rev_8_21_14_0_20_41_12]